MNPIWLPLFIAFLIFGLFEKHHTSVPQHAAAVPPQSNNCNVAREQRASDIAWMLGDLNRLRARGHEPALSFDGRQCLVAVRFADDLVAHHAIGHVSSDGRSPFDRMRAAGITYRIAGENVARATNVMNGDRDLWNDGPHRAIMLGDRFNHVGIAAVKDRDGTIVFVQDFTD